MGQQVQITVRGSMSPRLATAFDGMTPRHRRGHTDLIGKIADQAQLHALLSRIRDLGLELEKVTVLPEPEHPPPPRVVLLPVFGAIVAVGVPLLLALSGVIATTGVDPYRLHRPAVHPGPVRGRPFCSHCCA
jgi:hypothetical protein